MAAVGASVAHAAAFQNGSFETNGGNGSSTAAGWTFTPWSGGPSYAVSLRNDEGITNGSMAVGFNNGVGTIGLTTGSQLSQTFDTILGHQYHVTFDFGDFDFSSGAQALQATVKDGISNNLIVFGSGTVTNGTGVNNSAVSLTTNTNVIVASDTTGYPSGGFNAPAPNVEFSIVAFDFIADSTSSTIQFMDTVGSNTGDGMLDNVTLADAGLAPEPSTVVMLAIGTALVGLRRRRSTRA
jgi:hypothetical protein